MAGKQASPNDNQPMAAPPADSGTENRIASLTICIALIGLTWFVFGQTLRFAFVNYDDPEWVSQNPHITSGLTREGVVWAFQRIQAGPLASLSHMLDWAAYGAGPAGHHFGNVALHSIAVLLLFLVLRQMTGGPSRTGNVWRSAFVAALFAIHPLRVESVAWVTERKDVLSGLFFALTLGAYARFVRRPSPGPYLAVCIAFVLGLLAKGTLVTLPVVLLLLDYWPLGRFQKSEVRRQTSDEQSGQLQGRSLSQLFIEKIPLFALSMAAAGLTLLMHTAGLASVQTAPLSARMANALVSSVTYIGQMFYPAGLTAFYGYREIPVGVVVFSVVVLIGVSATAIVLRKRYPYLLTGWFWYLVVLAPVSGIVQAGLQAHADRYTYLPQIGLYLILAWGIGDLTRRWPHRRTVLSVAALVVVGCLAFTARNLAGYWRDSEALWTRAITVAPQNDFAHASLADLFLREGRLKESVSHSEAALKINPSNADALNNLALAISRKGRLPEAVAHWKRSLEIQPGNLNARCNLAWVLATAPDASLRNGPEAVELVEQVAVGTGHANVTVLQILGAAYAQSGRFSDAINATQQALELAVRQGKSQLADSLRRSISSYETNQPLRDETLAETNIAPPALTRPR
jgi:protein O-mannosyl-transferase